MISLFWESSKTEDILSVRMKGFFMLKYTAPNLWLDFKGLRDIKVSQISEGVTLTM
jgi:hypothetical protein